MNVAVLVDIIKETSANWRFVFEDPLADKINMESGMLVQLCSKPGQDDSVTRNYSVASWQDGTPRFELIVTYLLYINRFRSKPFQIYDEPYL